MVDRSWSVEIDRNPRLDCERQPEGTCEEIVSGDCQSEANRSAHEGRLLSHTEVSSGNITVALSYMLVLQLTNKRKTLERVAP